MTHHELTENVKTFLDLINQPVLSEDKKAGKVVEHYLNLNLEIVNNILSGCIDHLNRLRNVNMPHDVICIQARLTNEISQNLEKISRRFIDASLGNVADYNEWLKKHCDFATD